MKLSLVVTLALVACVVFATPALGARRKLHQLDATSAPAGPGAGPSPPSGPTGPTTTPPTTTTTPPTTTSDPSTDPSSPVDTTGFPSGPVGGGGGSPSGPVSSDPSSGPSNPSGPIVGGPQTSDGTITVESEAEVNVLTDLLKVEVFLRCSYVAWGYEVPPGLQTTAVPATPGDSTATSPDANSFNGSIINATSTGGVGIQTSPPSATTLRAVLIQVETCILEKSAAVVTFLRSANVLVIETRGIRILPIFCDDYVIGFTAFEFIEFEFRVVSPANTASILSGVIGLGALVTRIEYAASNARLFAGELRATALATAEAVVEAKVVALVLSALDASTCSFPSFGDSAGWASSTPLGTTADFLDPTGDDFALSILNNVQLRLVSIVCKVERRRRRHFFFGSEETEGADTGITSSTSDFSAPVGGSAARGISVPVIVRCVLVVKISKFPSGLLMP